MLTTTIILPGQSGSPLKSIRIDTALGNPIDNSQISEISIFESQQFSYFQRWERDATRRTTPTPLYNCHGMTFASRRTGIFDHHTITKILTEDGYTVVEHAAVLPGDVIIYYAPDGDVEHSGVVVSLPDPDLHVPRVVSKWGKYSEFVHWANNCPYGYGNALYYRLAKKNEFTVTA